VTRPCLLWLQVRTACFAIVGICSVIHIIQMVTMHPSVHWHDGRDRSISSSCSDTSDVESIALPGQFETVTESYPFEWRSGYCHRVRYRYPAPSSPSVAAGWYISKCGRCQSCIHQIATRASVADSAFWIQILSCIKFRQASSTVFGKSSSAVRLDNSSSKAASPLSFDHFNCN